MLHVNVVCQSRCHTRKPTGRPGRKAPTLRPDPNTSGTAGVRVVKGKGAVSSVNWEGGVNKRCSHRAVLRIDKGLWAVCSIQAHAFTTMVIVMVHYT